MRPFPWTARFASWSRPCWKPGRVSEFVALRVEDVSIDERVIAFESGTRRKVPIRFVLALLLSMHMGKRRSRPLFVRREESAGVLPVHFRQRFGQIFFALL